MLLPREMLKRFLLGVLVGAAGMYWYLHHGAETYEAAKRWFEQSAAAYRGDAEQEAARKLVGP